MKGSKTPKQLAYDVYEAEEETDKSSSKQMHSMDNVDFSVDVVHPANDEDIDDEEAFNAEDEERYGIYFEKV